MFLADGQERQNVVLSFQYIFLRQKPANLITYSKQWQLEQKLKLTLGVTRTE